ncbi:MAG: hypothetical protein CMH79_04010 [Nitrospinae bacterium]|nr:hypothetical protein [Nitrospinota bacterium]|tara:strand:+ start:486 stop:1466 length:981 start_codon:yes stop_codon:yes gene_type:complete
MKKILIIRFSSIGDIIFTTSVIEGLKDNFDCQIDFLTLSTFAPILESNPYINKIISLPKNFNLKDLIKFGLLLNSKGYTIVYDLHGSLRSKIITMVMKNSCLKRFKKPRLKRFLLFYLKINLFKKNYELTEELLNFVDIEKKYYPKTYANQLEIKKCQNWLIERNVSQPFITLVPGSAWSNKLWKIENYKKFLNNVPYNVVVLGSKKDSICKDISDDFNHVTNLQGLTDLRTSILILKLSKTVIGADTGLLHAAESLGIPIIMLSGPTSNYTGGNIRLSGSLQLYSNVWCRPCSKNGSRNCFRTERFCLTRITPETLNNALINILN